MDGKYKWICMHLEIFWLLENFAMQHSSSNSSDIEEKTLELVYPVKGKYPKTDSKTMKSERTRLGAIEKFMKCIGRTHDTLACH